MLFRLPSDPARHGSYRAVMGEVRRLRLGVMLLTLHDQSDLDILGARREIDLEFVNRMVKASRSSCLFTSDSGQESALA